MLSVRGISSINIPFISDQKNHLSMKGAGLDGLLFTQYRVLPKDNTRVTLEREPMYL